MGTPRLLANLARHGKLFWVEQSTVGKQVGVTNDSGYGVVDLVRSAGHHLAQCCQFLLLYQFCLQPLQVLKTAMSLVQQPHQLMVEQVLLEKNE